MKIDLHVHTRISSSCSNIAPEDMVREARIKGLDAVCVTEHDSLEGGIFAREVGKAMGFLVLAGVEVNTCEGDFVVFGLEELPSERLTAQELLDSVAQAGGVAIVAHPYRPFDRAVADDVYHLKGYHALEVLNGNTPAHLNAKAADVAHSLNVPMCGGSDAHRVEQIGMHYTEFVDNITDEKDLVEAIKSGRMSARSWERELE